MNDSEIFSGETDPEIEDLLGVEEGSSPNFNDLFSDNKDSKKRVDSVISQNSEETGRKAKFDKVTIKYQDSKPYFSDKNFYQKVLSGEGEISKKIHETLAKYIQIKDPKERAPYRDRLIILYWELYSCISQKISEELSLPKRLLLRFGVLLPNLISKEQKDNLSRIVFNNITDEPIHYADEWLDLVSEGACAPLATDEDFSYVKKPAKQDKSIVQRAKGVVESNKLIIRNKQNEQRQLESALKENVIQLVSRQEHTDYSGLFFEYSPIQRKALGEITEKIRRISFIEKDIVGVFKELAVADKKYHSALQDYKTNAKTTSVGSDVIVHEVESLRKLIKMCVGRRGNHFPVLQSQFFTSNLYEYSTRENVLDFLGYIESLDPFVFVRTFKGQTTRIVPHVILVPCYGNTGLCWEPFEKFNRATSRGRVGVPLFSKDYKYAVLTAVADLRWQVAKEKAQHYWMQEGLTGEYFQWFSGLKRKGDVKQFFIEDYILWITKESEGMQKLDKNVRAIFWRLLPFPQEIKDKLRTRGFVYDELYKKDINRAASVGY